MPDLATIVKAPKAMLHDHLDGGLRPATVVDLAAEYGYDALPTTDVDDLAAWFRRGADRKSLELYLETFAHTFGVMQWPDAIRRVAAECAEDLAADGVVYAEVRMAPELCTEQGLTLDEATEAILDGFRLGSIRAADAGHPITMKLLVTAMRQAARSVEVAECAIRWRDAGVVGFDVAGPEKGYPPTRYLDAFETIRRANFHITIHAGESFGLPSIWEALQFAGAERLGHGVRIVDDITVRDDGSVELGRLAAFVRDRRVPLEMCPSSNVHTGAAASVRDHPIDLLRRLRYRVTVNTDNRLMSGVSLSSEFAALDEAFRIGLGEMEWLTINAMKSAFAPFDERLRLINESRQAGLRTPARGRIPGRRRLGAPEAVRGSDVVLRLACSVSGSRGRSLSFFNEARASRTIIRAPRGVSRRMTKPLNSPSAPPDTTQPLPRGSTRTHERTVALPWTACHVTACGGSHSTMTASTDMVRPRIRDVW